MDDTTAACNMINTSRKSSRKVSMRLFRKSITTRLSIEHGRQLSVSMQVAYDPKTDSVVMWSCLKYCRHSVYPGTHQSRNCHSQHGINMLHAKRAHEQVYRDTHKEELNVYHREYQSAYHAAHKEELNARNRARYAAYYAAHKEELNARKRARYAVKKSSPRERYFEPEAL